MASTTKRDFDDSQDIGQNAGQNVGMGAVKLHRNQRKHRGHKLAMMAGEHNRREDRSGWAYAKRRSAIA
jgi:hypothetical protein